MEGHVKLPCVSRLSGFALLFLNSFVCVIDHATVMKVRTALADGTKLYPGDNKQKEKKANTLEQLQSLISFFVMYLSTVWIYLLRMSFK